MVKKSGIREQIKLIVRGMSETILREKSYRLSLNLKRFFNDSSHDFISHIHQLKCLGGFAPLKDEADWAICWPFNAGMMLAFPSFTKVGEMIFVISSFEDLSMEKQFGVKIPKTDTPRVVPEVLLVPGQAFSPRGDRLGRGRGFYDRYLAEFSGLKIGICFNEQIVGELPLEKHDISMNCIVTDEAIYIGGKIWI